MLSRLFSTSLRLRPLALALNSSQFPSSFFHQHTTFPPSTSLIHSGAFSTNRRGSGFDDDSGSWKFNEETVEVNSLFHQDEVVDGGGLAMERGDGSDDWGESEGEGERKVNIFKDIEGDVGANKESGSTGDEWETVQGFKPWALDGEEEAKGDLFGEEEGRLGDLEGIGGTVEVENRHAEELAKLEMKDNELKAVLKGPDRAFGDLITSSGITDEMLDSLILLKDVSGVEGLPSLKEIEDIYVAKDDDTTRHEAELKRQEEIAKARVRQVDEKGRAYGTGKRKCSVARVFIQPGSGKLIINDKQFDAYFTWLDHRAEILSPFLVTETIGRWDVNCTVKGGGLTGQVGAIRLGISRALQNWSPVFRELLRPAGLLTRDSRVVERKKPGKAKARKSFQWVKR